MSDRFEVYYSELFGSRWPSLLEALKSDPQHRTIERGLTKPYHLDAASIAVAGLLPLDHAERVLDVCAAPGGKALLLATRMGGAARLTANERSSSRRARLHRVVADHLPDSVHRRVFVTGHDARRWGLYERDAYDAILADVPCSSERHLVLSAAGTAGWNPRRSKRLAIDQFAILASVIDACRPGGYVLYATCTLNPIENDAVVALAPIRRPVEVVPIEPAALGFTKAERTEQGIAVRPDISDGAGPMFAALLQKRRPIG